MMSAQEEGLDHSMGPWDIPGYVSHSNRRCEDADMQHSLSGTVARYSEPRHASQDILWINV
jgi:hypothetical protein